MSITVTVGGDQPEDVLAAELEKALTPFKDRLYRSHDLCEQLARALYGGVHPIGQPDRVIRFSARGRGGFIADLLPLSGYNYLDFYMIGEYPDDDGLALLKEAGWTYED